MNPDYRIQRLPPETLPDGREIYAASFVELPGCIGQGTSAVAAEAEAHRLLLRYLDRIRMMGQPVPLARDSKLVVTPHLPRSEPITTSTTGLLGYELEVRESPEGFRLVDFGKRNTVA